MTTKNEALEKRPRPNGGVTGAGGIGIEREEGLSHRDLSTTLLTAVWCLDDGEALGS